LVTTTHIYTSFRNSETTLETGNLKVKDKKNVEVIELIPEWLPKSDNCSDFSMTQFFSDVIDAYLGMPISCSYDLGLGLAISALNSLFKGQLILKCPFGVFKSPKKSTKFFPGFLP
jgi:hypothetical protein